jgi:hypothetical protein
MKNLKKFAIPSLCLLNIIVHLSSISYLEFHRDELLYFSLSNHLELGYASVPPFISWMAWLAKSIFGFCPFAVKIFPALLSGAFIFLCTRIARELKGGFYAEVLTAVFIMCTPLSLRAFILFQPVPFDIFFWTVSLWLILKYINTESNHYLYLLGAVMGLALLNKYLILILIFSLLLVLPFTNQRKIFTSKAFYLSLLITLVIVSPNVYWQFANDFPVFTHMAELSENQLENVSISQFLLGQVTMLLLAMIVSFVGLVYILFNKKTNNYRLFGFAPLLVLAILILTKGKDYYAAGIYPFLIASGTTVLEKWIKGILPRLAVIILLVLITIPFLPVGIPFLPPEKLVEHFDKLESYGIDVGRIHENGQKYRLPQDYADMLGWYEIADLTRIAYEQAPDKSRTAIFGENYGIAGAVSLIGKKYGLPEALSFSDAYEFWVPESFDPDIETLIYINDELGSDVEALFEEIILIGEVADPLSRQYGVKVYLCNQPRRSFNAFWKETLKAVRSD